VKNSVNKFNYEIEIGMDKKKFNLLILEEKWKIHLN
jgi:hypothetical protein